MCLMVVNHEIITGRVADLSVNGSVLQIKSCQTKPWTLLREN